MTVSDTPPRPAVRDLLIEHRASLLRNIERARADLRTADAALESRRSDVDAYEDELNELDSLLVVGMEVDSLDHVSRIMTGPGPSALVLVDGVGVRWLATCSRLGSETTSLTPEALRQTKPTWPMTIVAVAR